MREAIEVVQGSADQLASTANELGQVAQPLRAAITGKASSPPLFEAMAVLGRDESLIRLRAYAA